MKPTISLYHVSGILPAQYRNDPASKGIAFASHARAKQPKEPKEPKEQLDAMVATPNLIDQLSLSAPSIHSFVRLIRPIDGFNLGGIYLIYKQNAVENTYSFSPNDEPTIPRWAIKPIDIYPGLELELKEARKYIKPGVYKVRSIEIDNLRCNISINHEEYWSHIYDGDLYLPTQNSQGA